MTVSKTRGVTGESQYAGIEDMIVSLVGYENVGLSVGDFLNAVLSNDLFRAMAHGDRENVRRLDAITKYIYNRMPSVCWGSKEKVRRWQEYGGLVGGALERIEEEEKNA